MFEFLVGNDALSAIVAFILVLIPAVLIHELGHFLAAKAVGITILEFGIGMPPRMLKLFSIGGTDYTLNWLPLGGFVRPLGEDMVRQMGDEALEADRQVAIDRGIRKTMSVNEAKPAARILFLAGGAGANFLLAIVLFTIIALMGIPQISGGLVGVITVDPNSALADAGIVRGDTITTLNGQTYESGAALLEALADQTEPATIDVVRPGEEGQPDEALSLTVAPAIDDAASVTHPIVAAVAPNSPAAEAGLTVDDMVIAFNGTPVDEVKTLQDLTAANLDTSVTLTVLRGTEEVDLELTPRGNPPAGEGAMGVTISQALRSAGSGITYQEGLRSELMSLPLDQAVSYSFSRVGEVFSTIASIPSQLLQGTADPDSLRITSPLGISQVGAVFLQESIEQERPGIILEFMALISIALGLTNLLPIPALDGGRILFVLIEVVRGRPISPEREGMVHLVGLALLLSLMVVVLFNDIQNPLTDILR